MKNSIAEPPAVIEEKIGKTVFFVEIRGSKGTKKTPEMMLRDLILEALIHEFLAS